jgi:xylose dehydrogenase (NAD/NADP)
VRKVNWGVLSTARIGLNAVIPAIRQSKNGQVVAIASRDCAKARETARALGIKDSYGSYAKLLESPAVDAVYVPLPNSLHGDWTIRAAEMGKHVLCEKPIALNADECARMISACARHSVRLMEAFMYRFHPQISKLKEMIDAGDVGKISAIRSAFRTGLQDLGDIAYQKELGGGSLMDVGCYCVNVARLLTGEEPTYVRGVARFNEQKGVDEAFTGIMRFPESELGLFDCGFRSADHQTLEVIGEKSTLELPAPFQPGGSPVILKHGERNETIVCETANHYRLMVEHFAECVLDDREPRYRPADSLIGMRAIDMLYESARNAS